MFDRLALVTRLSTWLQPILDKEPVYMAYLYGSTARGENTPLSDLDIALAAERDLAPLERLVLEMRAELELEKAGISQADVREVTQAPIIARDPSARLREGSSGCGAFSQPPGALVSGMIS